MATSARTDDEAPVSDKAPQATTCMEAPDGEDAHFTHALALHAEAPVGRAASCELPTSGFMDRRVYWASCNALAATPYMFGTNEMPSANVTVQLPTELPNR